MRCRFTWNRAIAAWLVLALLVLLVGCSIVDPERMTCIVECEDCKGLVMRCELIDEGQKVIETPRRAQSL